MVSALSSSVRRASSAAASGPGRAPLRRVFASVIIVWMRVLAAPARGSTEPVIGCGLYSSRTFSSASSSRTMFSPARITEVLPGLPSQPSQVGAYSTVVIRPAGAPAYGWIGASWGRPTSMTSLSSTPMSASW